VLCTRCEHTIRLTTNAIRHEVIDEHPDVGNLATENQGWLTAQRQSRVDPRDQPLCSGFFVAGRAIDLSRMVQTGNELGLE
jgi:hypothetical protein